ncbi:LCCL domain-containing protein [Cryptosporidium andersoni]|uniref:LCCL domain-containing protein n=1 Tax=Cryptosporidium andersoni TaxID=117008 RepID=A0A1J4MP68_9CRYT|nr:LCCL domain-containing protein [Cryptosporidium andersoni]
MKWKFKIRSTISLLALSLIFSSKVRCISSSSKSNELAPNHETKEFCRAAPLDGFADFGECMPPSNEADYLIEVVPVIGPGIDLRSEVEIVLYGGDESQTAPVTISSPETGTSRSLTAHLYDIGAPQQVGIFLKSDGKWKCLKITVFKDYRYWVFSCNGELSPKHRSLTYGVSGNKLYIATVMTGKSGEAGTKGGVEISLIGESAHSDKVLLKQGFYSSTVRRIIFRAADVGNIREISLTNTAQDDPWYCEFVRIQSEDGTSSDFTIRRWIGKPFSQTVTLSSNIMASVNTPAQDIDCQTRAVDILPRAPSSVLSLKVKCPINCGAERFSVIAGTGIHPGSTSICKSAIFDNILSPSGGELVLTVTPSMPKYFGGKGSHLLESQDFFPTPGSDTFGFYTYMSNSIDFIESEVRIVDSTGNLASVGRLEVHRSGIWGGVALNGEVTVTNEHAAILACKQLGYTHGIVLPSCSYVNGGNVCIPPGYPMSVAGLQCNGHEADITQCIFEEPKSVNPLSTVAIQCSSITPKDVIQGALRIVDANGSPSRSGSGRLEIYMDGWGSICSDGFTPSSEKVACAQMGYSEIKDGGAYRKSCTEFEGVNVCGKPDEPILAVDVSCQGNEQKLIECQHYSSSNIYCVHEEDVVVSCAGNGDPTGHGSYLMEKPPSIMPLIPYKRYEFACNDNVAGFSGAVGDGVVVTCPVKCSSAASHIKGTFIYTDDSPVCKAAIHAGIIDDNKGGDVLVMFVQGQAEYFGLNRNGINSYNSEGVSGKSKIRGSEVGIHRAITISKVTSSLNEADSLTLPNEIEQEELPILVPPVLSWVCPTDYPGFRGGVNDYIDATNLPGGDRIEALDDFTITARILISGGQGTWRTILAHTECLGISLYVDRDNMIHFDQLCNADTVSSKYVPTINEWIFLAVAYNFNNRKVTMYINGNEVANKKTDYVFNLKTKLIIGRSSDSDSEYFLGQIANLNIWDKYLSPEEIKAAMEKSWHQKGNLSGGELRGKRHTIDGRQCITPCQSGHPIAHKVGSISYATNPSIKLTCDTTLDKAPFKKNASKHRVWCPSGCYESRTPIKGFKVYTPDSSICKAAMQMGIITNTGGDFVVALYPGLHHYIGAAGKNGIVSKDDTNSHTRSFITAVASRPRLLNCYQNASFIFQLSVGERELVICPSDCALETDAKVYGMDIYSPMSSICRAAIHSSKLSSGSGGEIEIEVGPEQSHFEKSNRNGIQSESSGYYIRSFKII